MCMNIAVLQSSLVASLFLGSKYITSKSTWLFVSIKLLGKWLSKAEERIYGYMGFYQIIYADKKIQLLFPYSPG